MERDEKEKQWNSLPLLFHCLTLMMQRFSVEIIKVDDFSSISYTYLILRYESFLIQHKPPSAGVQGLYCTPINETLLSFKPEIKLSCSGCRYFNCIKRIWRVILYCLNLATIYLSSLASCISELGSKY